VSHEGCPTTPLAALLLLAFTKRSIKQAQLGAASQCGVHGSSLTSLTIHGRLDTVLLPAMADYILKHCKSAQASWYDGVGSYTLLEEALRFNTELKHFAGNAHH
jgi:hypothetical protein